jgi:putative membrane protein
MHIWVKLTAVSCLVLAGRASADDREKPFSDIDFIMKATSSGMTEVALAKIAETKATESDVKRFAQRLVTEHTKANEELARIVKEMKGKLPEKPSPEHEKLLQHFQGEVKNFDREYIKHMVDSHTKSVELFTKASKECKNDQLRAFAEKTLPTIKEHLEMAKKLSEKIG